MEERYGFKSEFPPSAPAPHLAALSYPIQPPHPSNMYPPLHPPNNNATHFHTPNSQGYRWVDSSVAYGTVPPNALHGGRDADGHPIFVGRAYHEGDLIPAKVIPGKNAAYVAHNGEEHQVEEYQILCKQQFDWVPCHAGHLPPGAIQGGHTSDGEVLYIGRVFHEGAQTIGKIHPSHGVCYIPFDGQEIACPEYETLVLRV